MTAVVPRRYRGEPWSRPSENREEGSGFRVCGEAAVGYALSPRPTLASRGHLVSRVSKQPLSHPHSTAQQARATRPRSISPGVNRVPLAPRRNNTHNSRHRQHRQFRQRPSSYRSATRAALHLHHNKRGSEAAILSEPARCTPSRRCEIALISRSSDARASPGSATIAYALIMRGLFSTTHQFPVRIRENAPAATETPTPYTCIRVWNNVIGRSG
ncbi:uncharacterized protein LOC143179535 [Calliopsis andreniformis]|uniref:uncharacterized protein LOC143179535 n=1 Tax=Calliopsis andreniformis TaxID=337506 RepID=UPI003FCE826D